MNLIVDHNFQYNSNYGLSACLSSALVFRAHFTVESVPIGDEPLTELFYVQKKPKGEKKWQRNMLIKNKLNEFSWMSQLKTWWRSAIIEFHRWLLFVGVDWYLGNEHHLRMGYIYNCSNISNFQLGTPYIRVRVGSLWNVSAMQYVWWSVASGAELRQQHAKYSHRQTFVAVNNLQPHKT